MAILPFSGYRTGIMSQILQGNHFFKQHSPNFDPRTFLPKTQRLRSDPFQLVTGHLCSTTTPTWASKTRIMCPEFRANCLTSGIMGGIGQLLTLQVLQLASVIFFCGKSIILYCYTQTPNKLLHVIHTHSSHGLNSRIDNCESSRNHKGLMRQLDFSHHIAEARICKHHIDLGLHQRTG